MSSLKREFMSETIFVIVNWASALMMIELGAILMFFKPGSGHEYDKYMTAKKWLSVACVTLGVLTVVNQFVPTNTDNVMWLNAASLCIAALQAMLFTMTILSIIATQKVTRLYVVRQMLFIIVNGGIIIACSFSKQIAKIAVFVGMVAYLALLVYYGRVFLKCFKQFRMEISTYYEEGQISYSLRWIWRLFWSALAIGLLTFLSLTGNRWFDVLFIVIYTIYYICFAIRFINYHRLLRIVQSAINMERPDKEGCANDNETPMANVRLMSIPTNPIDKHTRQEYIEQAITQWTSKKYYTAYDLSVEDVAKQMECTIQELHYYFREVLKTSFPLWRNQLRVEMAQQLMREQPSMTVQDIALQSGFNNRSYFYRKFAELTGTTVQEYRRILRESLVTDSDVEITG